MRQCCAADQTTEKSHTMTTVKNKHEHHGNKSFPRHITGIFKYYRCKLIAKCASLAEVHLHCYCNAIHASGSHLDKFTDYLHIMADIAIR